MAETTLNAAQIESFRATFQRFYQQFQQQLATLDGSKALFSFSSSSGVTAARNGATTAFSVAEKALRTGTYNNGILTESSVQQIYRQMASSLEVYAKALADYNSRSPTALLGDLAAAALNLAKQILDVVQAPGRFVKNIIIWGAVAVGAVILLPPLLRTFSAYKTGGSRAAADRAADELDRARERAAAAAKKGAELTARAAAAVATEGGSELLRAKLSGHRRRAARRPHRRTTRRY